MKYLVGVIMAGAMFCVGYATREYAVTVEPEVRWKTKVQTDIVYRDYQSMSIPQCVEKLRCYDTSMPRIEYKRIDAGTYRIGAGLCDREWNRDMSIEVGSGGNWKYFVGGAVGVGAVVGILYLTKTVR